MSDDVKDGDLPGFCLPKKVLLKELRHDILSLFLQRAKLPSTRGKRQNISLVRWKTPKWDE